MYIPRSDFAKLNIRGGQWIAYSDISYHPKIQSC